MNLKDIFDVFSLRRQDASKPRKPLTQTFRTRVLMLCRDRFGPGKREPHQDDYRQELWAGIHQRMTYLVGRPQLTNRTHVESEVEDLLQFLSTCSDEHFLDFMEYIFRVDCYWQACRDDNTMVEEVNQLLLLDDLPYAVTPFVREVQRQPFMGQVRETQVIVSWPRVVLREHQIAYAEAIEPAIHLLADKGFTSANKEFLDALGDYRRGQYGDCLTKCGSAFESTMKLICRSHNWPYQETDTAAPLLKLIMSRSKLDAFFEQPLLIIATLRNRLSSAHGRGAEPRSVQPQKARFALSATAAAILLLVEECT